MWLFWLPWRRKNASIFHQIIYISIGKKLSVLGIILEAVFCEGMKGTFSKTRLEVHSSLQPGRRRVDAGPPPRGYLAGARLDLQARLPQSQWICSSKVLHKLINRRKLFALFSSLLSFLLPFGTVKLSGVLQNKWINLAPSFLPSKEHNKQSLWHTNSWLLVASQTWKPNILQHVQPMPVHYVLTNKCCHDCIDVSIFELKLFPAINYRIWRVIQH